MKSHAGPIRILDAGCGSNLHFRYSGMTDLRQLDTYVVGIDISEKAVAQHHSLDERIIGDLQSYPLEHESFDLVICQDVLEHLPRPSDALANMARALKPGGQLILSCSNPASLKGIVTKLTPQWFHRFVYKRGWFGYCYEGPDGPPFKTYMRWSTRPSALTQTLRQLGLVEIDLRVDDFDGHGWLGRNSEIKVKAKKPSRRPQAPA